MKKPEAHHKGGKHHNLTRSAKHGVGAGGNHKYEKQAVRTAINKDRHKKKAKDLKDAAEKRRADKAHINFSHDESSY